MSRRFALISIILLALLILASCSEDGALAPAASTTDDGVEKRNNEVPIHFVVDNTIEYPDGEPSPPIIEAIFPGHGRSHPFGPFEMYATSEIDFTVYPQIQTAEYTFTYRNGDQLFASSLGEAVVGDAPNIAVFYGDITFEGGTGRFANASGSGTYEGSADTDAGIGHFTIDGTISGFGGGGN